MANNIELPVSKQTKDDLIKLSELITNINKQVIDINKQNISFVNSSNAQNLSQLNSNIDKSTRLQEKQQKQLEKTRLAEIRLQQARERAFDKYEKEYKREQARLAASENLYNKVQAKLNALTNEYKALAIKKELSNRLTASEEKRYATLQNRIQLYDKTLKTVDATMGKHQRNVGNYASAFNPISNSINQLTREMPAFTYSMQTGFMAISNNIPIFTDSIKNAIEQNKALQAQGKPTESVLSKVASVFFSWQTVMSVGITLLTVYGKEIGEFAKAAFSGSKALDSLAKSQEQIHEARLKGVKSAQDEITQLKVLLGVAKDSFKSTEQRTLAVKKLQEQYPEYLGNLSQEKILAGETADAENRLTNAILSRAKAQAATSKIVENQSLIIDLEENRLKVQKDIQEQEIINERIQKQVADRLVNSTKEEDFALSKARTASDNLSNSKRALAKINKEINELQEVNNRLTNYAIQNTILFDDTKSKEKKKKAIDDIISSEYELRKAILQRKQAELERTSQNQEIFINERIDALNKLYKEEEKLINLTYHHSLGVEKQKKEDKIKQYKDALKEGTISEKDYARNIKQIELQSAYDVEQINVELGKNLQDIGLKKVNSIKRLEQEKKDFIIKNEEQINKAEQKRYKDTSENEKLLLEDRQIAYIEFISLAKKELDIKKIQEIANAKSIEEIDYIINKYKELQSQFDLMLEKESPFAKNAEWLEKFRKQFETEGFGKGFDKILFIIDNFDKLKQSGSATALAISEAFQQMYNTMNENAGAFFDRQIQREEERKDIALKFAGDSATAREEIERISERRIAAIKKRQAEAEKRLAMFNIVLNTAQAVIATYARLGFTPQGIAAAIGVGVIGAAQLALASAQPIPAFAEGGVMDKDGYMLVNDAKGINYKETIVEPDGNIKKPQGRNVLMKAKKGTKIYTPEQWDNELAKAATSPLYNWRQENKSNNTITKHDLKELINAREKDNYYFNVDKNGVSVMVEKQGQKVKLMNNRLRITNGRT